MVMGCFWNLFHKTLRHLRGRPWPYFWDWRVFLTVFLLYADLKTFLQSYGRLRYDKRSLREKCKYPARPLTLLHYYQNESVIALTPLICYTQHTTPPHFNINQTIWVCIWGRRSILCICLKNTATDLKLSLKLFRGDSRI